MMTTENNAEAIFRRHSRSFSLAARLFPKGKRLAIARLYAFCRYLDNLADDSMDGEPQKLKRAREVLLGHVDAVDGSPEQDFIELSRQFSLPGHASLDLTDALLSDCGSCRIETADELIRFAYGVAGTVGLLMCPIIDTRAKHAVPFAIDLGIALQLTNIARDIAEDAMRDRFYLPAEWVPAEQVLSALDGKTEDVQVVDAAVQQLLCLADRYYASARTGMAYIPARHRKVIFLATGLYEGIGEKLRSLPSGSWSKRTILNPLEKGRILFNCIPNYRKWSKETWMACPQPQHEEQLHDALRAYVGVRRSA